MHRLDLRDVQGPFPSAERNSEELCSILVKAAQPRARVVLVHPPDSGIDCLIWHYRGLVVDKVPERQLLAHRHSKGGERPKLVSTEFVAIMSDSDYPERGAMRSPVLGRLRHAHAPIQIASTCTRNSIAAVFTSAVAHWRWFRWP